MEIKDKLATAEIVKVAYDEAKKDIGEAESRLSESIDEISNFKKYMPDVISGLASSSDGFIKPYANSKVALIKVNPKRAYKITISGGHNRTSVFGLDGETIVSGMKATLVRSSTGQNDRDNTEVIEVEKQSYKWLVVNLVYNNNSLNPSVSVLEYEEKGTYFVNGVEIPNVNAKGIELFDGSFSTKTVNSGIIGTDASVKSAVIPVEHNKDISLSAVGTFNRFLIYGCNSTSNGSSAVSLYQYGKNRTKRLSTKINTESFDYIICILNYADANDFVFSAKELIGQYDNFSVNGIGVVDAVDYKFNELYDLETECHIPNDTKLVTTYNEVISLYDELVSKYPNFVHKTALNNSSQGTVLYQYQFSTGDYNDRVGQRAYDVAYAKPKVLLTSGIHGYERSSVMSTYRFCRALCEDFCMRKFKEQINLLVIPVGCPDGYDADTRTNAQGININRNFETDWTPTYTEPYNFPGNSPADAYETQIIESWMRANTDALIYIDHHNSDYNNEVCFFGVNRRVSAEISAKLKKHFWNGIKPIYPYWKEIRCLMDENIYAYVGSASTSGGVSTAFSAEIGIPSVLIETSWQQNNGSKHGIDTIAIGAEVIASTMLGLFEYFNA